MVGPNKKYGEGSKVRSEDAEHRRDNQWNDRVRLSFGSEASVARKTVDFVALSRGGRPRLTAPGWQEKEKALKKDLWGRNHRWEGDPSIPWVKVANIPS